MSQKRLGKLQKYFTKNVFKINFSGVILYFLVISIVYVIMALVKHSHYQTFADLGIFNQGVWQYSQFKFPFSSFHLDRFFLGDHFHPILILLAPLYWLFPGEKTLLFIQPFILLSAMIPIFFVSYRLTKSYLVGLSIVFAYSLYLPLQFTLFYDFHEVVFLPPIFAWSYYFYLKDKRKLLSLFLVLLLLVKEEVGFFVGTFALFLLIFKKGWRKFGFVWFFIATLFSLFAMFVLIPKIGGSYLYFGYGNSGSTPINVLQNFLHNPISFISLLFDTDVKRKTLFDTFYPFGFLSLFSPMGFMLSLEQFFSRFIDLRNTVRWSLGFHYSAPMAVITALGTAITSGFLIQKFSKYKKIIVIVISLVLVGLTRYEQIGRSAVLMVKRPEFWARSSWMDDVDAVIAKLPAKASVSTQNNLVSHLSTRQEIYFLDKMEKTEYILIDLHPGQDNYNFFGEDKKIEAIKKIEDLILAKKITLVYQKGDVFLYKK